MLDLSSNWGLLTAQSRSSSGSSSFSQSSHSSYSGLREGALKKTEGALQFSLGKMPGLLESVIYAHPNQKVLQNLDYLSNIATQSWVRNVRPLMNFAIRGAINNLANRGILDSSVASKVISNVQSRYFDDLANHVAQLQQFRINKALSYPLETAGLLQRYIDALGNIARIGTSHGSSLSSSSSTSVSYSYNPAPAVSFLGGLLGI